MNDLGSSSLGMIFPRPFINVESPSAHFQSSLPAMEIPSDKS